MKKLNTINIKGKEYVMVKDRVVHFNETYPKGRIVTEIVKNDELSVVCKARVYPDVSEMDRVFTGHSEAYRGQGQMGQVPVEIAETSAVGRALAMLGIGIVDGIASADEMNKALPSGNFGRTNFRPDTMSAKPISPAQKRLLVNLEGANGQDVLDPAFLTKLDAMNSYQASQRINELKSRVESDSSVKSKLDFVEDLDEPPVTSYDEN